MFSMFDRLLLVRGLRLSGCVDHTSDRIDGVSSVHTISGTRDEHHRVASLPPTSPIFCPSALSSILSLSVPLLELLSLSSASSSLYSSTEVYAELRRAV